MLPRVRGANVRELSVTRNGFDSKDLSSVLLKYEVAASSKLTTLEDISLPENQEFQRTHLRTVPNGTAESAWGHG